MIHLQWGVNPGPPPGRSLRSPVARKRIERIGPLAHVDGPVAAGFDDQDRGAPRYRGHRPGNIDLGTASDLDQDLAGTSLAPGGNNDDTDAADQRGVLSHRQPLLETARARKLTISLSHIDRKSVV